MQTSLEEDILEDILAIQKDGDTPTLEKIASRLSLPVETILPALERCRDSGLISSNSPSLWTLTKEGRKTAEVIARRHAVLACFLTEKLGLEAEAASREACLLEHDISEETIDALDSFMQSPDRQCRGHGRRHCAHYSESAPLINFSEGETLIVTFVRCPGRHRRLIDLGVIEGEPIIIRRKLHNEAVVISVKGCDIALSPEIASEINARRRI
ncbi:metal-dependent transcriptional regulator [Methanocalculus taiwanensis]|uniref:Metal-dependent transcriptional regulator n=1 Tax=Methanocalculus taiwanensis TaxID=106207 RepID=A0ABD4TLL5_9EURY|nr:metal-dependent transcriptional regulator [Methanocalculus taiwanensis]MCQ1538868.1 metal-dependent transcriptional regulator [Methanocalculus taiwanensis]